MIRTIVRGPDPILTTVCSPFVFGQDDQVILDLQDTIKDTKNARGLAAPQIGHAVRAFGCNIKDKGLLIFVNPSVVQSSLTTAVAEEGCLSFPWLSGVKVSRPERGTLRWTTPSGKEKTRDFEGWDWRCILHELDHLNGITLDVIRRGRK
jgi:peptide deformylase